MAIDIRQLSPTEFVRLVNSTPLGPVLSSPRLHRQMNTAGYRIGDGKTINLVRYVSWLAGEYHAPKKPPADYEAMKAAAGARNRELSAEGRDIGELPAVVNAERKKRASSDFKYFCEEYFPDTFTLRWSPDHLKVITKIEQAVLHGGLFAMAMPRGSGKTSICECACLWAILFGHREFVCLIGSDEAHAEAMLDSIKMEFEINDRLLDDFPEAVFPIQCLEGIPNRCGGQTQAGARTHMEWTSRAIVLPTIAGSKASGAIIKVAGLTGRIRGMKYKRTDKKTVRPSLVILDDPQTDESARSLSQCQTRESIIAGAVLGLAGPGRKIAGVMPCTVIRPGDMADRILDRDKHPQWQGERTKMVYAFPTNEKLWAEYARIRAESLRSERGGVDATEFYAKHREAMDAGAIIAWPERHNPDELSAIQHAMNLKLQDEAAFFAEYQNEPLVETEGGGEQLTAEQIAAKTNGMRRGDVPVGANHLTMFIDPHKELLFWCVAAWEDDFTGYVIDYGTWPDQRRPYFTLRDAKHTLARQTPGAGLEGAIYAGLETLTDKLLSKEWRRDDGAMLRIERCLIDANWGESTDIVYQFCRQSRHAAVLLPSHGRFVGASSTPFSEYKRKRGDRIGLHWRIPNVQGRRSVRHALIDTNYWKSFVHARLAVSMGDPGCLSLFGRGNSGGERGDNHQLISEHLTAEFRVKTEARGRVVDEWKSRVGSPDNHWLDCLTGCAVAASIQGGVLFGTDYKKKLNCIKLSSLKKTAGQKK